jgi:hypothetical protein
MNKWNKIIFEHLGRSINWRPFDITQLNDYDFWSLTSNEKKIRKFKSLYLFYLLLLIDAFVIVDTGLRFYSRQLWIVWIFMNCMNCRFILWIVWNCWWNLMKSSNYWRNFMNCVNFWRIINDMHRFSIDFSHL